MSYTTNSLSLSVVQRLLRDKQAEMDRLVARRDRLIISQSTAQSRESVEAELAQVNTALAEIEAQIANMPEGELKTRAQMQRNRLENQQLQLTMRLGNIEGDDVPEREFDLAVVQFKIAELTIYITDLQAREATLSA